MSNVGMIGIDLAETRTRCWFSHVSNAASFGAEHSLRVARRAPGLGPWMSVSIR